MSTAASQATAPIRHTDRFFIGGQWVAPSSSATIQVIDPGTEEPYFTVAEAQAPDIARAVSAARDAFDTGPWPRLTHTQRAEYLRAPCGRRDHPVERADAADRHEAGARPDRRLHGHPQDLPEAPGEGYLFAEAAEAAGLPPGVINVVCADREVSELLVRDPRVDKISFTGSTAAGRKIGAICGERVARCTLELGKSAAVILDDADHASAAAALARAECILAGQVCASLTRIAARCRLFTARAAASGLESLAHEYLCLQA